MLVISQVSKHEVENYFVNISSLLFYVILLAIPPIFYLYTVSLSDLYDNKIKTILPHFYIVFALGIINIFSFIYLSINHSESFMLSVVEDVMNYSNYTALLFIFPILNVYYIYKAIQNYFTHQQELKNVFSFENNKLNIKWMRHYILGYIIFIFCIYIFQIDLISTPFQVLLGLFMISYLLFTGIKGLKQKKVHFKNDTLEETDTINRNAPLEEGKIDTLKNKVLTKMVNDQLYLDHNLTIHNFAKALNSNSKTISHVLNTEFQQNFVSFVNTFRVQKAQELLSDLNFSNYTIEAISDEVGFNSKSAFNRAFKKYTNSTPSQYKKEQ
ncbi:MAG: helix-turn-helix domain-containing protein [Flavobacteriaceae bacterium]